MVASEEALTHQLTEAYKRLGKAHKAVEHTNSQIERLNTALEELQSRRSQAEDDVRECENRLKHVYGVPPGLPSWKP